MKELEEIWATLRTQLDDANERARIADEAAGELEVALAEAQEEQRVSEGVAQHASAQQQSVISELEGKVQRAERELATEQHSVAELHGIVDEMKARVAEMESRLEHSELNRKKREGESEGRQRDTAEQLQTTLGELRLTTEDKEELEQQLAAAQRSLEESNRQQQQRVGALKANIDELTAQLASTRQAGEDSEREISGLRVALESAEEQRQAERAQAQRRAEEARNTYEAERAGLLESIRVLHEKEQAEWRERLEAAKEARRAAEREREQDNFAMQEERAAFDSERQAFQQERVALRADIDARREQKSILEAEISQLEGKHVQLKSEHAQLRAQAAAGDEERRVLQAQLATEHEERLASASQLAAQHTVAVGLRAELEQARLAAELSAKELSMERVRAAEELEAQLQRAGEEHELSEARLKRAVAKERQAAQLELQQASAEHDDLLKEAQAELARVRSEHERQLQRIATDQKGNGQLSQAAVDSQAAALHAKHGEQLSLMQKQHEKQLALVQANKERQLAALKEEHEMHCARLEAAAVMHGKDAAQAFEDEAELNKQLHVEELDRLRRTHAKELERLLADQEQKRRDMVKDLAELERLKTEHQAQLNAMRAEATQRIQRVHATMHAIGASLDAAKSSSPESTHASLLVPPSQKSAGLSPVKEEASFVEEGSAGDVAGNGEFDSYEPGDLQAQGSGRAASGFSDLELAEALKLARMLSLKTAGLRRLAPTVPRTAASAWLPSRRLSVNSGAGARPQFRRTQSFTPSLSSLPNFSEDGQDALPVESGDRSPVSFEEPEQQAGVACFGSEGSARRLRLRMSACNLVKTNWLRKSDPQVMVSVCNHAEEPYSPAGSTEIAWKTHSPTFERTVDLILHEDAQMEGLAQFEIFDRAGGKHRRLIGRCVMPLVDLVGEAEQVPSSPKTLAIADEDGERMASLIGGSVPVSPAEQDDNQFNWNTPQMRDRSVSVPSSPLPLIGRRLAMPLISPGLKGRALANKQALLQVSVQDVTDEEALPSFAVPEELDLVALLKAQLGSLEMLQQQLMTVDTTPAPSPGKLAGRQRSSRFVFFSYDCDNSPLF